MPTVAQPLTITTPDGRSLDVWLAGPPDGEPLVFHHGTPSSGLPFDHQVNAMAERGLQFVGITRPGYGSSTRHQGRTVGDVAPDTRVVMDHLGIDRSRIKISGSEISFASRRA